MSREFNIGIDLGLHGGIVVLAEEPYTKAIAPLAMPTIGDKMDYHSLYKILENYKGTKCHVVFEKLGVIFGSSKATAFSMGYQSGALEAFCIALKLPYTMVQPKIWQKEMFQGVAEITKPGKTTRDTKAMALVAANRLFPYYQLVFGRASKPNDGIVDALLLASYCQRKL